VIDVVVPAGALLGECPVWSAHSGALFWIDIEARTLHRYDPASGADERRELPGRPGSFALTSTPGRFLVAVELGLGWYDWDADEFEEWLPLEEAGTGNRSNDGRCDPAGRFWVGSMYERPSENRFTGKLHRVDPDGTVTVARTEVGVSNGLGFSPDGRTMYFADTLHDTVWSYDYDVDSGELRNERLFFDYTTIPGRPDGGCVDADGCYWSASVHGWAVVRISADGSLDRRIELPLARPTMCAFGGPDLGTLFVTSIGAGGPVPGPRVEEHPGAVLAIDVGVTGLVEPVFAGRPDPLERSKPHR